MPFFQFSYSTMAPLFYIYQAYTLSGNVNLKVTAQLSMDDASIHVL